MTENYAYYGFNDEQGNSDVTLLKIRYEILTKIHQYFDRKITPREREIAGFVILTKNNKQSEQKLVLWK